MKNFAHYWKAIIAAVPLLIAVGNVVVGALQNVSSDGHVSAQDILSVVITAITAYGVYAKANEPAEPSA